MKKILILILLFPEILFCQNLAGDILKNVSQKTSSYKNIEAHFTTTIINESANLNISDKGVLFIKDDSYRIEMKNQKIISDGQTNWIHLIEENEVQIMEIDDDEENINPSKIFTLYENGYNYNLIEENQSHYIINLIPIKSTAFISIELKINKKEMHVSELKLFDKNGGKYIYFVTKFITNQNLDKKLFYFDSNEFPNLDIIDLR